MSDEASCRICHKHPPREGGKVCDVCMGYDRAEPPQNPEPPTESTLNLCQTCGALVEPYKLGRNLIVSGICHPCVMRKKYGPEWTPGGSPAKRKACSERYLARKRAAMQEARKIIEESGKILRGEHGPEQDKPVMTGHHKDKGSFHGDFIVHLAFDARDQGMYKALIQIARTERLSLDQQILYLLDQCALHEIAAKCSEAAA